MTFQQLPYYAALECNFAHTGNGNAFTECCYHTRHDRACRELDLRIAYWSALGCDTHFYRILSSSVAVSDALIEKMFTGEPINAVDMFDAPSPIKKLRQLRLDMLYAMTQGREIR